jgi:hypothetical protein
MSPTALAEAKTPEAEAALLARRISAATAFSSVSSMAM